MFIKGLRISNTYIYTFEAKSVVKGISSVKIHIFCKEGLFAVQIFTRMVYYFSSILLFLSSTWVGRLISSSLRKQDKIKNRNRWLFIRAYRKVVRKTAFELMLQCWWKVCHFWFCGSHRLARRNMQGDFTTIDKMAVHGDGQCVDKGIQCFGFYRIVIKCLDLNQQKRQQIAN